MKIMKKIVSVIAISLTMSISISYANTNTEIFPLKAKPGSIIEYSTMAGLKQNEYQQNDSIEIKAVSNRSKVDYEEESEEKLVKKILEEAKQYPIYYLGGPEIPEIEDGMKAYYDGMGDLTKIVDKDGNNIMMHSNVIEVIYPEGYSDIETRSYTNNGTWSWPSSTKFNTLTRTNSNVLATGWVTWYDGVGKIGNHDNILTNNDCATKMSYDRPPSDTEIRVRNLENDKVGYVYKNDVGGLPNAVLDIMPNKMKNTFGAAVNINAGTGRFNGRYFYER